MEKKDQKKERTSRGDVRIGISIGDVNGIGIEVTMKALEDARMLNDCTPIIYGSQKLFSTHKKQLRMNNFNYTVVKDAESARRKKINIIDVWDEDVEVKFGETNETGGKYAFLSLEAATSDLAAGKIDVLVTAPISKEAMAKTGFQFPGHTEYLADMAGQDEALMLMISSTMKIGLVTSHIALKDVSTTVTADKVLAKISAFNASLKKDFGIQRPKIAVFGLNPHAGENGKMGTEEKEAIVPAIGRAQNDGIFAYGPFPADGFFGSSSKGKYDGVLAMYHDQGLAAFKALAFDEGVNFTAGLPIIRTSPDHGTAFDIAGKNTASGDSMRQAIYLAIDVFRKHLFEKEITTNVLVSQPRERRGRDTKRNDN
ncbi:MAG: 4-hydroxythreonine-4-phosphate dehydrogenase PdxA [Crocinitomicaceae bacterium]|nr:4-hydroxythreonine-4-phosphate dehydrogenase PdxA [Flavobacteriales bacterium]NQZ35744.1 4-hydroxythreonine-4-phosphate dehydrogenase PdxA [Crocinitomicaceae bacterium]PHR33705.1 MAG: 4-hydroxythreonine-4-phosphate dehydrogenase PdxA [Fluviicola sp.]